MATKYRWHLGIYGIAFLGWLSAKHLGCEANVLEAQRMLVQNIDKDTSADPFALLSKELKQAWSKDTHWTINETIRHFLDIRVRPTIEVRLVGFDGQGHKNMFLHDSELLKYLNALKTDMDTVAMFPQLADIPVIPEFHWVVKHHSNGQMIHSITQALQAAAAREKAAGHDGQYGLPVPLSHSVVDDIVAADSTRDPYALLTLYLINPDPRVGKYAYRYVDTVSDDQVGYCLGTHFVGSVSSSRNPRYVWMDLTAGPVSYGPGTRQTGHVFEHSTPHVSHYQDRHAMTALAPHLAALTWSATQHLVWPPMHHSEISYGTHVTIQVIHIHDHLTHATSKFDQELIRKALADAVAGHQEVDVHEAWLPISDCPQCMEILATATKTRTSRDEMATVLSVTNGRVLDQIIMHRMLASQQDTVMALAGLSYDTNHNHKTVPVFIWEVEEKSLPKGAGMEEPLLFIGGHQAVAYDDMVMAVVTKIGQYHTPAICGYSQVLRDTTDANRAILGAVLQSAYGVANISTTYTSAAGLETNHLWSVSNTPFGHFSASTTLSGPLAGMIPRNLALVQTNRTTARLAQIMYGFAKISRKNKIDGKAIGDHKERIIARVNIAVFKVHEVITAMSHGQYWEALKYARSLKHDVSALERLVLKIHKTLPQELHCERGPTLSSVWWAPVVAIATWPVATFLRAKLYKKKFDKLY